MNRAFHRQLLLLCTLGLAIACSRSATTKDGHGAETTPEPGRADGGQRRLPSQPEEHKDEPEGHEELPTRVSLGAEVVAAAGIRTSQVSTAVLPLTASLTGELVADPDRSAKVAVRVAGRIIEVRFQEGRRVKAGELLAVIESKELAQARAAYVSASVRAGAARKNAGRLERIAAKGLAAGQEVADAEAEARSLEAAAKAHRQTLASYGSGALAFAGDAARLRVHSPIAGVVLRRDAVRGQSVSEEHVIGEIADLDRLWFLGRLFEKDLARVKAGAAAAVRLNAYPDEVFRGTVDSLGGKLDAAARTVVARIALRNRDELLKVGLFGTASVVTAAQSEGPARLVVPLGAVTRIAERDVVFVRQPDGHFELHPVTLGRNAAGRTEVLTGLRAGEHVVVEGIFTLKSAVLKSTFAEEE